MVDLLIWLDLALVCVFVSGNAYLLAYPYAWTVNFEMRLEGNDLACISAGRSERISAYTLGSISADGSKCMSIGNSIEISIISRLSKMYHFL